MIPTPLISVIIPCYNHGQFLTDALQSVYEQLYTHWECIVINDGSTDNTETIAQSWCNRDKRFKYFYKKNEGLSSARNMGLREASGNYIQFLDADDLIDINKFKVSMQVAGEADVIMSGFAMFLNDKDDHIVPPFTLSSKNFNFLSILIGWDDQFVFPPNCGIFKSSLFWNVNFNEELKAKEDWVMWLQIYQKGIETVFIDEPFALYRLSPNSMSRNKSLMDKNLVLSYKIIFKIVPLNLKDVFFDKAINSLGKLLENTESILLKTRQSKSYRLGNFFVRNAEKVRKSFK